MIHIIQKNDSIYNIFWLILASRPILATPRCNNQMSSKTLLSKKLSSKSSKKFSSKNQFFVKEVLIKIFSNTKSSLQKLSCQKFSSKIVDKKLLANQFMNLNYSKQARETFEAFFISKASKGFLQQFKLVN
jgi:hypothetical protein